MQYQFKEGRFNDDPDEPYPNSGFRFHGETAIQTPSLTEDLETAELEKGFWKRQFGPVVTLGQRRFDWIFGVIMPVICIAFDPIVFIDGGGSDGLLTSIRPFAYLLSYTSIMAMIAWLLLDDKLKGLSGALAGLFAIGAVVSLAIGIFLFPFSVIGLIVAIGALGFTPLLTSIVFFRNSARAYRSARTFLEAALLRNLFALSALASAVVPSVLNMEMRKGLANQLEHLLR